MTLKTATINDLLGLKPCYDENKICALARGRTEFNALDVLRLDIPTQDKFWVVLRPELLDERTARLFACNCAEHVLHLYERDYPNDKRPCNAIGVGRRFANGAATEDKLVAARDAAGAAARAAAGAAAGAAARAAARAAAWDAARDAARAAAGAAAWDAAGSAAWAAEKDWQTQNLIELISETIAETT